MLITRKLLGRLSLALLATGFAVLLVIGGASIWLVERSADYRQRTAETQELRAQAAELWNSIQDIERGQRGFLLTGDERYLEPYTEGLDDLPRELERLRVLTAGNASQQQRLAELEKILSAKLGELANTVELGRAGDAESALTIVRGDQGRQFMRRLRAICQEIAADADRLLLARGRDAENNARLLLAVNILGAVVIAGVALASIWLFSRYAGALQTAQVDLQKLNEGLEETVQERTADLTRANEEMQRFVYIVSHDLRAPLVNIMGFTGELQAGLKTLEEFVHNRPDQDSAEMAPLRELVETDVPEAIGFIRTSTDKMDRLIGAILKLAREGRRVLRPEPLKMTELLEGISNSLKHQTDSNEAEITIEKLPDVIGDRLAVEQIFSNLVENAVKYLKPGQPGRIVVRGKNLGRMAQFEIEDNGRGIDPKDRERVFELFRRAGAQDRPGEGIGLAHVRTLVRRLGGTIDCSSELGQGSTFRLTLPKILTSNEGAA